MATNPIDLDGMRHAADESEDCGQHRQAAYLREGADEIERLRVENAELRLIAYGEEIDA